VTERRLFFIFLFVAGTALAQNDPTSRSWNQPVEPFRIHGNVYYVGANEITSFLITTPKGHIVIDGGFEETAPMILANIRKLGFEPRDVKYLVSSHAHLDHAGGLAALKNATGATFLSSVEDLPAHARGGLDDPQFGDRFPYPPIEADRMIRDRERVTLGGTTMTAHITPGHTRGCTTWTTRAAGKDFVFFCSPSIPSEYRLVGNPRYPDAAEDYRRQFARLETLSCEVFLASHGNFFDLKRKSEELRAGKKKAFIDPAGCTEFVARMKGVFERRLAEQTR
jgi:metallo-beta-lactamase class B